MVRKHFDRLMDELGYRCDMRAVVIVEFWAMMAGALPFGACEDAEEAAGRTVCAGAGWAWVLCHDEIAGPRRVQRLAWAAEYAARPRIEVGE